MNAVDWARYAIPILADSARSNLMAARIQKQIYVVYRDLYRESWGTLGTPLQARKHFEKAKELRLAARSDLDSIGKLNGTLITCGCDPLRLSYWLCGRNFENWPQHKSVYKNCALFVGTDPG